MAHEEGRGRDEGPRTFELTGRHWSPARFVRVLEGIFFTGTLPDGTPIADALGVHFEALTKEVADRIDYLRILAGRKGGPGLAFALNVVSLLEVYHGTHWWRLPGYEERIEWLLSLDEDRPDPATLRPRLLAAPWQLSDDQAWWLVNHRYDIQPAM